MKPSLEEVLSDVKDYLKLGKDLSQLLEGDGSLINCYNHTTHRLHGKVDTIGTTTSRMTHSRPNVTQTPRTEEFRVLHTVPEGKLLIDIDASALELMTLGHYLGPYDDHEFMKAVATGDKSKGTDIHTLNQKRMNLPTRDAAKTAIYSINYGGGATKVGSSIWDKKPFEYLPDEYHRAREQVYKRVQKINGIDYFPVSKGTLSPVTEELIIATIFGARLLQAFRDNTKGYNELVAWCTTSVVDNHIKALDGRWLYLRSAHKALNLYLQSAGAIYMKYVLCMVDDRLREKYTHGKEFAYVSNIHDAFNLEVDPDKADDIAQILKESFRDASYQLGFKYPIEGEPHIGKNQWETH